MFEVGRQLVGLSMAECLVTRLFAVALAFVVQR
jgi:hypothetical protein